MRSHLMPLTNEQILEEAPSVGADSPHPKTSGVYVPISTLQVVETMKEAGYGVSRAQQTKSRDPSMRVYGRHLLTFRPLDAFSKPSVGDAVPEVILINSHDGNCSYRLHVGLFRFVCANGIIAGHTFETVSIRHRGMEAMDVVTASESIFKEHVPKLRNWVESAAETKLSKKKQLEFATEAQAIRFEKGSFDPVQLLDCRRIADAGDDLWRVYNRVQENVMAGGIGYKDSAQRNRHTRPINRVTKDVIFNQQLWDVANEFLPSQAAA